MSAKIGIVIITHGTSGPAMLATIQTLLGIGATDQMEALAVAPQESPEIIAGRLRELVARVENGRGVLVVSDLRGATPANCGLTLKSGGWKVEVLCGVNLPMLIKLATLNREAVTLTALIKQAGETARRSIRLGDHAAVDEGE